MRKKITIFLGIVLILAGAGWWAWDYFELGEAWEAAKFNVESKGAIEALEDYFKNDSYGGKTPQETYALYLEALKRGDLNTASLYFFWERQVEQKKKLEDLKAKGELEKYIADLPEWGELEEEEYGDSSAKKYSWIEELKEIATVKISDGAGGFVEHTFQPGKYEQEIDFQLNKSANIWKIYSL